MSSNRSVNSLKMLLKSTQIDQQTTWFKSIELFFSPKDGMWKCPLHLFYTYSTGIRHITDRHFPEVLFISPTLTHMDSTRICQLSRGKGATGFTIKAHHINNHYKATNTRTHRMYTMAIWSTIASVQPPHLLPWLLVSMAATTHPLDI